MEFDHRVLDDARFPGRQGRLLFAYLVTEQGRPVPREELADILWGDRPPATWDKALSVLVSKLRALLTEAGLPGAQVLTNAFGCYRLDLPDVWVDIAHAEAAARTAEEAIAQEDWAVAVATAEDAESRTRSVLLPGESGEWVERKRREQADVRWRAVHALAQAYLGRGDLPSALRAAERAIELEPFRESGYRLLMQAHAAQGNNAEALRVYERCRRLLDEELGTYPSAETDAIYQQLLEVHPQRSSPTPTDSSSPPSADEPSRHVGPRSPADPRGRVRTSRRRAVWVGGCALAATAVLVAGVLVIAPEGGGDAIEVTSNSIVQIGSSGSIVADVPVGIRPIAVAEAAGFLWIANQEDRSVTRLDAAAHRVLRTIPVDGVPTDVQAVGGFVWVTTRDGGLVRIDPQYNTAKTIATLGPAFTSDNVTPWRMLADGASVWVLDPDGYALRLDGRSARETGRVDVGNDPSAIARGAGAIWVTNRSDGTVTTIDPQTLVTTTFPVGHGPSAIAVSGNNVWVASSSEETIVRIDPQTRTVAAALHVGRVPTVLLATEDSLWMGGEDGGAVVRLDPRNGSIKQTVLVGGSPTGLIVAGGSVWASVAAPPEPAPARGGTVRLTVQGELPSLDPARQMSAYSRQLLYATCANLVTYPDAPQPGGTRVVPDVAEAVPTPTDGGRTYTFTIRAGFRFSPPSGQPVTAQTFKSTLERTASPALKSPDAGVVSEIDGYDDFVSGRAPSLSGVVARGSTLTVRLTKPDGGFLAKLAGGVSCVVPDGTPAVAGGVPFTPSAGPYYVASYTAGRQVVFKRNPDYRGNRPRRLDQIVLTGGVDAHRALTEIVAGASDYALDGLPGDAAGQLEAQYGPSSAAAQQGRQQYFVNSANAMRWLYFNVSRPLFSHVRLRQAVNYAVDRPAIVAQDRRYPEANPFNGGTPTSDYLNPAITGARDLRVYPVDGPDLARARSLAGGTRASAVMYTPNQAPWLQEAEIIRSNLKAIGIDVQVAQFPIGEYFDRLGRPGEPYDLAIAGWNLGDPDPVGTLMLFEGRQVHTAENLNFGYFANAVVDRKLRAIAALSGPGRYRAAVQLELEVERDYAPVAALTVNASRDFFSARVGCQTYQPVFGMDLAALCLR